LYGADAHETPDFGDDGFGGYGKILEIKYQENMQVIDLERFMIIFLEGGVEWIKETQAQ
jgi:hypothetical protein